MRSSFEFHRWLAAVPALCLGLALAPAARAADDIVAGSVTNSPPMIAYASDGTTLEGAIVDLAAGMGKKMGRNIVFKAVPFSGLLPAMKARHIDIVFTMMNDTAEREKLVDFVDFYNLGAMLLVKKGNPNHVESLETLCGQKISSVQGSTQIALVNEVSAKCTAAGNQPITNLQYSQPSDARLQLQIGRVVAFFGSTPVMVYLAKTAENGTLFDVIKKHEYQLLPMGIAVGKDNTALRDALQKALSEMMADGSYLKILEKYGIESGALKSVTINAGANVKP